MNIMLGIAIMDKIRDIVHSFSKTQFVVLGICCGIVLLLGFFIGAVSFYSAGVKKGDEKGEAKTRKAMAEKNQAMQDEIDKAQKAAAEKEAALAAEKAAVEEKARKLQNTRELLGDSVLKERKNKITLLTKREILEYADGLNEYLPANVYERGGENLPDSCRVGICTFMFVYERKGMVKIVLRLHKKTADALSQQFKQFSKAVCPKGDDWYKWILTSEVTNLDIVTAAIRMAYKYTYLSNYDEETQALDAERVNAAEAKINESILHNATVTDREFVLASDQVEGAEMRLCTREDIVEYAKTVSEDITITDAKNEISPIAIKVKDNTFAMVYDIDGVLKIVFRASDEFYEELKAKHSQVGISPFPRAVNYNWYMAMIDDSFLSSDEVNAIIAHACNYIKEKKKK